MTATPDSVICPAFTLSGVAVIFMPFILPSTEASSSVTFTVPSAKARDGATDISRIGVSASTAWRQWLNSWFPFVEKGDEWSRVALPRSRPSRRWGRSAGQQPEPRHIGAPLEAPYNFPISRRGNPLGPQIQLTYRPPGSANRQTVALISACKPLAYWPISNSHTRQDIYLPATGTQALSRWDRPVPEDALPE